MRIKTSSNLAFFGTMPSSAVFDNLAKYDWFWQNVDQSDALTPANDFAGAQDWTFLDAINAGIKSRNPATKHGLYVSAGAAYARPWDPMAGWLTSADSLHAPDGTPFVYNNGSFSYTWANYADAGVRERHIAQYLAFLGARNLDGIFFDNWNPLVYAWWINGNSGLSNYPGGLREGRYHLTSTWVDWLKTWTTQFRDALEAEGYTLEANGLGPVLGGDAVNEAFLGTYASNTGTYVSGMIFELGQRMYKNPAIFVDSMTGLFLAQATGTAVWMHCQPWVFRITDPDGSPDFSGSTVAYTLGRDLERFYLATYLIWADSRSYFGYSDQIAYFGVDAGGHAYAFWSPDWDKDFGEPTGRHLHGGTTGLWWRQYTLGYAVVNPTASGLVFTQPGTYRLWDATTGPLLTVTSGSPLQIPPDSGYFLFNAREEA
jgi:hypothetical protein